MHILPIRIAWLMMFCSLPEALRLSNPRSIEDGDDFIDLPYVDCKVLFNFFLHWFYSCTFSKKVPSKVLYVTDLAKAVRSYSHLF